MTLSYVSCYLRPLDSYELMCDDIARSFAGKESLPSNPTATVRLVGLLFARPQTSFVMSELLPSFGYYHERSGDNINFYCPGFVSGFDPGTYSDDASALGTYSDSQFNEIRSKIEARSSWRYSGGADLLLTNARLSHGCAYLDFSSAIAVDLIKLKAEKVVDSVDSLFERIFQYAENQDGSDPTWGFSDRSGLRLVGSALKNMLLESLPKGLQKDAKSAFHFVVSDVSLKSTTTTKG